MSVDLLNGAPAEEFDPELNQGIDEGSIENNGPSYPVVQWHYGDPKARKAGGMDWQGGWFVKEDAIDASLLDANGWEATEWTHDNASVTEGFYRREIAVSVIAQRKRWEVKPASGPTLYFAWKDYNEAAKHGRPSGRLHVLVLVKGLESIGPVVLTLKGAASQAFEGKNGQNGVIPSFVATVITAANRASQAAAKAKGGKAKPWPYRGFWLPVGADRQANGEPNFIEVGQKDKKKVVVPIALGLPAKADQVEPKKYFVGATLLQTVNDLFDSNEDWRKGWDTIAPGTADANNGAAEDAAEPQEEATIGAQAAASLGL